MLLTGLFIAESEEEVEEPEEQQPSPEAVQDDSGVYYDPAVR